MPVETPSEEPGEPEERSQPMLEVQQILKIFCALLTRGRWISHHLTTRNMTSKTFVVFRTTRPAFLSCASPKKKILTKKSKIDSALSRRTKTGTVRKMKSTRSLKALFTRISRRI